MKQVHFYPVIKITVDDIDCDRSRDAAREADALIAWDAITEGLNQALESCAIGSATFTGRRVGVKVVDRATGESSLLENRIHEVEQLAAEAVKAFDTDDRHRLSIAMNAIRRRLRPETGVSARPSLRVAS